MKTIFASSRGALSNRFPGVCQSCRARVPANAGYVVKQGGSWLAYCPEHVPQAEIAQAPKRELRADGTVVMGYDPGALDLLRAMPGARWQPETKTWRVSLAQIDRARVLEMADRLELDVAPELRKIEETPDTLAAVERAMALPVGLYPYQIHGVRWLAPRDHALLADDMGLGKTVQAICALPEGAPIIVVAPSSLKYNWQAEFHRWRPSIRVTVLAGRGNFRAPVGGEAVIINFDILPKEPSSLVAGTALIVDEATACKNYKAARTQNVTALAKLASKVWFLSGTPVMNRPFELWGMLSAGGMERTVFGGWTGFMRDFQGLKGRWGGYEFGGPLPSVPEKLRRVMLRRTKEEVLPDLPQVQLCDFVVPTKYADDMGGIWDDLEDKDRLPAFEELAEMRGKLAKERVEPTLEFVERYEEEEKPLLVFSAHRAPIDALATREGWAVITGDTAPAERQSVVERFQRGELKGVGLTIKAGGMGLTLTHASHVLFVDLDWTPAWNSQAIDRVRRIGQTASSIQVTRFVADHPLDRRILQLLTEKMQLITAAVEKTIAYAPKPLGARGERPGVVTQDEHDVRYRAWQEAKSKQEREEASNIVQHRRAKLGLGTTTVRVMPPALATEVRGAWESMHAMCDKAKTQDGAGFNKPDAAIAWGIAYDLDSPEALELAYEVLQKYKGQIGSSFPLVYDKKMRPR